MGVNNNTTRSVTKRNPRKFGINGMNGRVSLRGVDGEGGARHYFVIGEEKDK